jgi:ubiquinone biosynthesis protein UbiJ
MASTAPWLAGAEAMINRNLTASSKARQLLARLEGTRLDVRMGGFVNLRAAAHSGHLSIMAADGGAADATISGRVGALFKLLKETGVGASAAANSGVSIQGDAEIANLYKELLMTARPDLEEELSRVIGDLPARQLSRVAHGLFEWLEGASRTARQNVAEYLTEESRDLVSRTELEEFLESVDGVRETADRIEARLRTLEVRRSAG